MATIFQTWSIISAVILLAVQLCIGKKSCSIWSSAGPVVQRDSSFRVYCTFNCRCKGSMYSDHPPTLQSHTELNSTTIYFNVVNITKNRTYSCQCNCSPKLDPCGLDISVGYPPDQPKNITCIYKVTDNKSGVVLCGWNRGRDTYLRSSLELWVRTLSGNHTGRPDVHKVSHRATGSPSVTFTVSRSVQLISVWVQAQNQLGSAVSPTVNYTLSDIAMPPPPILGQPTCSSRECIIKAKQPVRTQHLEIQYKAAEETWTSYPEQMSTAQDQSISSLEPYTLYHFRARSKFSTGLWSQWSTNISSWTQEEAPAKEFDVWYAEAASQLKSPRLYWKEANISVSRGKIIEYKVRVYSPDSGFYFVTNISADARNYSVPNCTNCEVTLWARNTIGLSPPARITARHTTAKSAEDVQATAGNHSVTISWRKAETAPLPTEYVVEWYPEGHKLEELRWVRLGGNDSHVVITDIKPFECYEGAVYAFYNENSVSRTTFAGVTTLESDAARTAGPDVQERVDGHTVTVTWTDLPQGQRGGCITNYTIYLKKDGRHQELYSVRGSERMYTIRDLSPASYSLWMTASTAKGEGVAGQILKFHIQQETSLYPTILCGVILLIVMVGLCLCQSSAVKRKFWVFFHCLKLAKVPDPQNSKWAKECTQGKGNLNLQLQLSNSSVTEEEEVLILVDVEEVPKQNSDTSISTNVSSLLPPQSSLSSSLSPDTKSATLLYPLTTYIKSFSHDSENSDHTQTSLDTNTTIDYISTHGLENMEEEDQEEEEGFTEMLGFFPSHNVFIEQLGFGGKLTLDAVKIDCSNFFQNS